MKIFLIGLPGCGKSTLGKQLADALYIPFIDLDQYIEKIEGAAVKDIFKSKGEAYFRLKESAALKHLSETEPKFVIATGGGAPVFHDNMKLMNEHGITIFLDVPAREIANRIQKTNMEERPLLARLAPDELKDQIEFLRSQRIGFYNQSTHKVSGDSIRVQDILRLLHATR
jgi:shikimate kinase